MKDLLSQFQFAIDANAYYLALFVSLTVPDICGDILAGANDWLQAAQESANYQKSFRYFMQRYPTGLSPYISGVPVIS